MRRKHRLDAQGRKHSALTPTLTKVAIGEDDLSEWDEEELRRGRRRDKNGNFTGPDPQIIPTRLHQELMRRIYERAEGICRDSVEDAVRLWSEVVRDPEADMNLRMRAAENIVVRVLGKPMDRVQVEANVRVQPWLEALEGAFVGVVGSLDAPPEAKVIDVQAQPVSEDDLPWDEAIGQAALSQPHRQPEPPEPIPAYDDTQLWEKVAGGG